MLTGSGSGRPSDDEVIRAFLHTLWHLTHPHQECEPEEEVDSVSDVSLCRQMLYDAFNDPESIAEMVRLPAISDEVAEMEQRAHVERLTALTPVLPLLMGQSDFMGVAAAALQCAHVADADESHLAAVAAVFTNIIKASVIASVSTAVAMGVLEINKEVHLEQ